MKKIILFAVTCSLLFSAELFAQFPGCPAVSTATSVTIPCGQTCTNLTANAFAGAQTTAYTVSTIPYSPPFAFNTGTQVLVNTDDLWSGVISLPFHFCFFGNNYNQIIVGSNGVCSFNVTNAGAFNSWQIPGAIPSATPADLTNCIMAPWQDIDPTNQGQIYYEIGGTAPCRYIKFSWYNVPYYGDPNSVNTTHCQGNALRATQQVILYETSNVIDMYIQQKQVCSDWNSGYATQGIQNAAGTIAYTVPGRNASVWTATNDAKRFTPSGAPNYTIAWFLGATQIGTGSTINVCPAGPTVYTAKATYTDCDASQIVVSSNVTVGFSGTSANLDSVHQISCFGGSDGAVYASYNTGSAILSYGWSPGGQGQTHLDGIPAGTYIFSVTDAASCTRYDTVTLANPPQLLVNVPDTSITSCLSNITASLTASPSGGTPGYTYNWNTGPTTQTLTGVGAGTYTVTVHDSKNCTASDPGSISVVAGSVTFNAPVITDATCANNDGSITVSVSGAVPTVNYTWSNSLPNSATQTGLASGTYSVTSTDANGCSATASYTVGLGAPITFGNPVVTTATCAGNDGSIVVTVNGATQPVNFTWSNSLPNNDTVTGLAAGTYNVTATDAHGCSATASYTVGQTAPITFGAPLIEDASCIGNNGTITVTVIGATPPVNYAWSNSLPNSPTQTGLSAGTYTVTATDVNNCSVSASYSITQAPSFTFGNPVIANASCGGSNGSIVVTTNGAALPVDFAWSNSLPNNDTVTGLAAGTYTVTGTDANGCSATASYTVGQGASFTFGAPVITNATCAGNNGSIVVTTNGATQPINFNWSSGLPNNDTVTGLAAGSYGVTATDANGCSATADYNVGQGSSIVITNAVVNDVSCSGLGSITITATGGTGTLTYSWSGSLSGNPLTGLIAGTYNLTITDQGGCSATATYIVGASICGDCPAVSTTNNVTIPCGQTCAKLTATAVAGAQTTAYTGAAIAYNPAAAYNTGTPILVSIDDRWSGVINLPFNFCFFGNTYGQLIVGSNGVVSFNTANANNTNSWQINGPIPSATPADLHNCIMGPWQDMDPTYQGQIHYSITGTYPCRHFIVSWYQVPMYGDPNSVSTGSCSAQFQTQQIVLYETTNVIDVFIQNKGICTGWNNARAIEGIQNAAGTVAYTAPGRNGTSWTATNDGYRFTPAGAPNYVINWFQGATQIGTGDSITVCPSAATNYTVQAVYTNCDNSTITVADSVHVNVQGGLTATVDSVKNLSCFGGSNGAVYASYTSTGGTVTSYGWTPGGANQTSLTGIPAGTYIFTVTNSSGCTVSDTATITSPPQLVVNVPDTTVYSCSAGVVSASLTATASGGTAGYTYDWGGGQTNATITGLGVGSYLVTATDANSCSATGSGTVSQVTTNPVLTQQVINVSCNGANDGSIIVSLSQATSPFTFSWSGGLPGSDTVAGLAPGTYSVTGTDANGCSATGSYTITEPTPVIIGQAVITDATCLVGGTITVTASGGTGTITYGWSNGDSGSFIDSVAGGPITLTVTDANGCSATASYTVGAAAGTVTFGTPTIVDVTCNGGNNGSITATATGGTGTITFVWSTTPQQTGATISGLSPGSYSVTITDANGCSASTTYTVNEPTAITLGNPTITSATCTTGGTITLTGSGGTGTLTYGWSNGDTGNFADSLAGGSVSVTVTDANGCSITATYTITAPNAISFGNTVVTNITCNGANNGSIHVIVIGGTSPISYTWNPAVSTDSIATGLPQGSYSVTITDNGGCSASTTYTITEPAAIALGNATIVDETCSTGGSITAAASGGTGTLTYSWSGPSGALTGNPITGLTAGTYNLTVTDANGCSITASYTVAGASGAITFGNPTLTEPSCNSGTTGSIIVVTSGGTGTIGYAWNPGSSATDTLSGIGAGTYNVTASDANGCSSSASYTLSEPAAITLGQPNITPVTCTAGGSVSVTASGGTGSLTLNWSNGDTGNTADSLAAGAVTVTVTDANQCSITATYTINSSTGISFGNSVVTNITCNGAGNGSIHVVVIGGTPPIVYTWNPQVSTDSIATGLSAGTYSVTVSDIDFVCTASATFSITEPAALTLGNATIVNATCSTGGSITANASGGTGTLTYTWSGGHSGNPITGLAAGTYTLTVTDASQCSITASYTVTGASGAITFGNPTLIQPTCNGGTNGSITVVTSGGTGTIGYVWGGSSNITATLSGIGAGNYNVTASDPNGCSSSASYTLGQPTAISLGQPNITPVTCTSGGSVSVTASGGTGSLTMHWSNGDNGDTADSLAAGAVTVTVTDANQCSVTASYTITTGVGTIAFGSPIINNISCNGANDGSITVNASGGTGTITFTWGVVPTQVGATITGLAAGSYTVTASDQGGCSVSATYTVTNPAALSVTVNATALLCFGDTTGTATASATGGTGNYTYHWNTGATASTVINQPVGIILVTVTDANGCTAANSAIIGQSPSLSYNSQVNQPTCADLGFGTEILTPRGGTGAITVAISGLGVNTTLTMVGADTVLTKPNVPTGNYTFTLTDALGCKTTGNFFVNAGAANQAFDVNTDSTTCYGQQFNDGAIMVTPLTLANAPYTYSLNGGTFQSDSSFHNLAAGNYTVITKNVYGCLDTLTALVSQPAQVFANASPDTILTAPGVSNQITVTTQNYINPVYSWSPVAGLSCADCFDPTATVDVETVYYVTVSESSNKHCAAYDSVVIIVTGKYQMPNAFSPNGDGKNDFFGPVTFGLTTVKDFRIYNRWGELVHNDVAAWDGKLKGKDQPADTYIYYISVETPDAANPGTNKIENSQGAFTLLR